MPHTSSAKKRARQYEKRRLRNKAITKAVKKQVKAAVEVAKTGTAEQIQTELKLAIKKLDKAAAKKVIHRNQAARKKSQLARLANQKLKAASSATPAPSA